MAWQAIKLSTLGNDIISVRQPALGNAAYVLDPFVPGADQSFRPPPIGTFVNPRWDSMGLWFNDAKTRGTILYAFEMAVEAMQNFVLNQQYANQLVNLIPYGDSSQAYNAGASALHGVQRNGQAASKMGVAATDRFVDLAVGYFAPAAGSWGLDTGDAAGRTVVVCFDGFAPPLVLEQSAARYRELLPQFLSYWGSPGQGNLIDLVQG